MVIPRVCMLIFKQTLVLKQILLFFISHIGLSFHLVHFSIGKIIPVDNQRIFNLPCDNEFNVVLIGQCLQR